MTCEWLAPEVSVLGTVPPLAWPRRPSLGLFAGLNSRGLAGFCRSVLLVASSLCLEWLQQWETVLAPSLLPKG